MSLQHVLSSEVDFQSLAGLARRGVSWWIGQLSALTPPGWRERLSGRPAVTAEPLGAGGWRFFRHGQALDTDPFARGARKAVGLVLAESTVLVRELPSPRMSVEDLRRMVRLDLDRLSPLPPELIHFDVAILDREDEDGGQRNTLGLVHRDIALRTLRQAEADGLEPASLGVRAPAEATGWRFDFLPAVREAAGQRAPGRAGRYWWGAVAALMVLNLALLVGRDMNEVAKLRGRVEAERPVIDAVLALKRRVEGEDARRRALVARGLNNEPLRMLNTLTEAMPLGAWVQHLEWNGKALHVVGLKSADVDVAAALRGSGAFMNPRVVGAQTTSGPSLERPFDVTADARSRP